MAHASGRSVGRDGISASGYSGTGACGAPLSSGQGRDRSSAVIDVSSDAKQRSMSFMDHALAAPFIQHAAPYVPQPERGASNALSAHSAGSNGRLRQSSQPQPPASGSPAGGALSEGNDGNRVSINLARIQPDAELNGRTAGPAPESRCPLPQSLPRCFANPAESSSSLYITHPDIPLAAGTIDAQMQNADDSLGPSSLTTAAALTGTHAFHTAIMPSILASTCENPMEHCSTDIAEHGGVTCAADSAGVLTHAAQVIDGGGSSTLRVRTGKEPVAGGVCPLRQPLRVQLCHGTGALKDPGHAADGISAADVVAAGEDVVPAQQAQQVQEPQEPRSMHDIYAAVASQNLARIYPAGSHLHAIASGAEGGAVVPPQPGNPDSAQVGCPGDDHPIHPPRGFSITAAVGGLHIGDLDGAQQHSLTRNTGNVYSPPDMADDVAPADVATGMLAMSLGSATLSEDAVAGLRQCTTTTALRRASDDSSVGGAYALPVLSSACIASQHVCSFTILFWASDSKTAFGTQIVTCIRLS